MGVLIIGLGLMMIVIGVMGTQHQILDTIKGLSPKLRQAQAGTLGKQATTGTASNTNTGGSGNTGGGQPALA